jgi:hypothetical protein
MCSTILTALLLATTDGFMSYASGRWRWLRRYLLESRSCKFASRLYTKAEFCAADTHISQNWSLIWLSGRWVTTLISSLLFFPAGGIFFFGAAENICINLFQKVAVNAFSFLLCIMLLVARGHTSFESCTCAGRETYLHRQCLCASSCLSVLFMR